MFAAVQDLEREARACGVQDGVGEREGEIVTRSAEGASAEEELGERCRALFVDQEWLGRFRPNPTCNRALRCASWHDGRTGVSADRAVLMLFRAFELARARFNSRRLQRNLTNSVRYQLMNWTRCVDQGCSLAYEARRIRPAWPICAQSMTKVLLDTDILSKRSRR